MYHTIYPIAKQFYGQQIAKSKWQTCQCGMFKEKIKHLEWKYRAGLNELVKQGQGSRKGAYYGDLKIMINSTPFIIELLEFQVGEVKKTTQPTTRPKKIGTGLSFGSFMHYYFN